MGTYVIGSGGDYATIAAAEAALTLPEVGGTIYEFTGTVVEAATLSSNYTNGLVLRAKAGEEADGLGGGAFLDGALLFGAVPLTASNLRLRSLTVDSLTHATQSLIENCDIGENTTADCLAFDSGTNLKVVNSIIRDGSDDGVFGSTTEVLTMELEQVTVVDSSRYGVLRCVCTDVLVIGSGTGDFLQAATGSNYNAASDTSAPGANSVQNRTTADLVNYAGGDYNLAVGSALNTLGSAGGRIGANISSPATSLTLDSAPSTMAKAETGVQFVVSTPATVPTDLNSTVVSGGDSLTVTSVTGSDPYTINCTVPLNITKQAGSYAWTITVDAENVVSASIPLTVQAGWTNIVLATPLTTSGYMLEGYTGDAPVTNDTMEYETTATLTPGLDSEWIWTVAPTVTQIVNRRVIKVDGTVGATEPVTFTVSAPVAGGGILRDVLRLPLSNVLRNVLK